MCIRDSHWLVLLWDASGLAGVLAGGCRVAVWVAGVWVRVGVLGIVPTDNRVVVSALRLWRTGARLVDALGLGLQVGFEADGPDLGVDAEHELAAPRAAPNAVGRRPAGGHEPFPMGRRPKRVPDEWRSLGHGRSASAL